MKNIEENSVIGLKNELVQVIINILNNAKDALEDKDISPRLILIDTYKENKNLLITIKDNAGGISEEIIGKVFELYFTTKHQSQGTGIGLYMSEEIIKNHMNGNIRVSNEQFKYKGDTFNGAVFTVMISLS